MVGKQAELSSLQYEPEMSDRAEGGQQLPVEGGVPGARPRQLLGASLFPISTVLFLFPLLFPYLPLFFHPY